MLENRDLLHRDQEGRCRAGLLVLRDEKGPFITLVYTCRRGHDGEPFADLAMTLRGAETYDLAVAAGLDWALKEIPGLYDIAVDDLKVELLDEPEFT